MKTREKPLVELPRTDLERSESARKTKQKNEDKTWSVRRGSNRRRSSGDWTGT